MEKYVVGREDSYFIVLKELDESYVVIARCPNRDYAVEIVEAFSLVENMQNDRLYYNGH